jgi:hypothetical protein
MYKEPIETINALQEKRLRTVIRQNGKLYLADGPPPRADLMRCRAIAVA